MMELDNAKKIKLVWGALIGLFLGTGAAWLLIQAPSDLDENQEPEPISPSEILSLTGAAATLIRRLDDFRHRM